MKLIKKLTAVTAMALFITGTSTVVNAVPLLITTLDLNAFPPYGDDTVQTEINKAIAAWNLAPS